jgi:ISXO2-like transposase domain
MATDLPFPKSLQERGFDHLPVAERDDAKVAEEYMPRIHLVFSNLKTWISGVHHGVDPQHLQAYCNEFTFRFNRRCSALQQIRRHTRMQACTLEGPSTRERFVKVHEPDKHGCWMNECADNRRACPTCSPSKRECFRCGKPAQNPSLPLCMSCDLDRLERGETAADILKVVAKAKEKT